MKIAGLKTFVCLIAIGITGAARGDPLPDTLELVYKVSLGAAELGSLSSKLAKKENHYEVVAETRAEGMASILLGGTVREICRFSVNENAVKPEHYRIIREGKDAFDQSVSFDWEGRRVLFSSGVSLEIANGYLLDSCSVTFALMIGGAPAFEETTLHIVGGKRVRQFENVSISKEEVSTPLGVFDTIKLEQVRFEKPDRKLIFWLAPSNHNIPIKIVERRSSRPDTTMLLKSVNGL